MTTDKTTVRGDVLIDDKPKISGSQRPAWQQILFTAPYNTSVNDKPRLDHWKDWEQAVLTAVRGEFVAPGRESRVELAPEKVTKEVVATLPDFSHLLPPDYRADYLGWRAGKAQGAKGEAWNAAAKYAALQDASLLQEADDFTEVTVFRSGYANWRRGGVSGAKSIMIRQAADAQSRMS